MNADLRKSRAQNDVIQRGQEVRKQEEDTVPDDVPDQLSSPRQSEGHIAPSRADISDHEGPTTLENRVQTSFGAEELDDSFDENTPTLQSAVIDCNSENNMKTQPSPGERQRPLRRASCAERFRDAAFDTQFEPRPRRRNCKRIRQPRTTGNYVINKEECFYLGRGVKQGPPIAKEHKGATPAARQPKTTQTSSTASFQPRHFSSIALPPDLISVKTSTNLQKRLRTPLSDSRRRRRRGQRLPRGETPRSIKQSLMLAQTAQPGRQTQLPLWEVNTLQRQPFRK